MHADTKPIVCIKHIVGKVTGYYACIYSHAYTKHIVCEVTGYYACLIICNSCIILLGNIYLYILYITRDELNQHQPKRKHERQYKTDGKRKNRVHVGSHLQKTSGETDIISLTHKITRIIKYVPEYPY